MFNYDWFHGAAFEQQKLEAKRRCVVARFPDVDADDWDANDGIREFCDQLEIRTLVYLRDGFSYEVRDIAEVGSKSHLTFECEPVDERYRVGAFVVTVPFDEIVRVEVYAVHASEKPDDLPTITGFRHEPPSAEPKPSKPPKPTR